MSVYTARVILGVSLAVFVSLFVFLAIESKLSFDYFAGLVIGVSIAALFVLRELREQRRNSFVHSSSISLSVLYASPVIASLLVGVLRLFFGSSVQILFMTMIDSFLIVLVTWVVFFSGTSSSNSDHHSDGIERHREEMESRWNEWQEKQRRK